MRVAVRDQREFVAALTKQAGAFDGAVEVVPLRFDECREVALGHRGGFDLVLASTDWIAGGTMNGALLPLTDFVEQAKPQDWPEGWHPAMHKLTSFRGHLYGFPYHDGPQVLHYRADIVDDPSHNSQHIERFGRPLLPPTTWQEFVETAQFFTHPENDEWGCCFAGFPDGHNNVYDFLVHLWSRGGEFFSVDGEPEFNSRAGVEALEYLCAMVHTLQVASPECLQMNSVQSGDAYAQGKVAMMWNWSGYTSVTENPEVSTIVGKNRTAPMPGGVSINSYWVMALLATCEDAAEAYRFMRHLTSPEMDNVATLHGVSGVRLSTWNDPEIQARFPVFAHLAEVHDNSKCLPQRADYDVINRILSQAIDDALNLRVTPATALEIASQKIKGLKP
ncbi:MAG: sugar ABC transporter substrate-binding protein [Armatimonadetes bacterium]|nr:sugar ABC transporter substrate-binding protein [Armatimonadota bacterium]